MQDRETALKLEKALNRAIDRAIRAHGDEVFIGEGYSGRESLLAYFAQEVAVLASPLSAPPQEPTGASPQAETRRDCTCLGTCRGAEGLGPRWKCALETPGPVSPVEPTPEPETCEWRIGTHHLAKAPCFDSPWFGRHAVATWNGCPYCLKPLRLVPRKER